MIVHAAARRYGSALFAVAQQANKTEAILQQFATVVQSLTEQAEFYKLLKSPLMTVKQKQQLVQEVWSDRLEPELARFLELVINKQREAYLEGMYAEYERLYNEAQGIVEVDVESAVELDNDTKEQIVQKLEQWLGKQVLLNTQVKPELLAGLRIQVGDRRIDGSLNARLRKLVAAMKGIDSSSKGVTFS